MEIIKKISIFCILMLFAFSMVACGKKVNNTEPTNTKEEFVDESKDINNSTEHIEQTSDNTQENNSKQLTADDLNLSNQTYDGFMNDKYVVKQYTDKLCRAKLLVNVDSSDIEFGDTEYCIYIPATSGIYKINFKLSSEFNTDNVVYENLAKYYFGAMGNTVNKNEAPIWYNCWSIDTVDYWDEEIIQMTINAEEISTSLIIDDISDDNNIYNVNNTIGYFEDNKYYIPIAISKNEHTALIISTNRNSSTNTQINDVKRVKLTGFEKVSEYNGETGFDADVPYDYWIDDSSQRGWVHIKYIGNTDNISFSFMSDMDRFTSKIFMDITNENEKKYTSITIGDASQSDIEDENSKYEFVKELDNYNLYRVPADKSDSCYRFMAIAKDANKYASVYIQTEDKPEFITEDVIIEMLNLFEFTVTPVEM